MNKLLPLFVLATILFVTTVPLGSLALFNNVDENFEIREVWVTPLSSELGSVKLTTLQLGQQYYVGATILKKQDYLVGVKTIDYGFGIDDLDLRFIKDGTFDIGSYGVSEFLVYTVKTAETNYPHLSHFLSFWMTYRYSSSDHFLIKTLDIELVSTTATYSQTTSKMSSYMTQWTTTQVTETTKTELPSTTLQPLATEDRNWLGGLLAVAVVVIIVAAFIKLYMPRKLKREKASTEKFCLNCGKPILTDSEFCSECGTKQ